MKAILVSLSARIIYELSLKPRSINELSEILFEPKNVIGARLSELKNADMIKRYSLKKYSIQGKKI